MGTLRGTAAIQTLPNFGLDLRKHELDICQNIEIPESDDLVAFLSKPPRAGTVISDLCGRDMRKAIDLDNQLRSEAREISEVRTDRMLPAKPHTLDPLTPQSQPKLHFGWRRRHS